MHKRDWIPLSCDVTLRGPGQAAPWPGTFLHGGLPVFGDIGSAWPSRPALGSAGDLLWKDLGDCKQFQVPTNVLRSPR